MMDEKHPLNDSWSAHLRTDSPSSSRTQRHDYQDGCDQLCAGPSQHNQPPSYKEIFSDKAPRPSLLDTKPSHSGATSSHYSHNTVELSRSISDNTGGSEILPQALEFAQAPLPPRISHQRLRLPIAIPQVVPGLGQPFSRGYGPELSEHGVSMEEFVKFIDNLNVVSAGSPPLQVMDLAGGVVGFVPIPHAQLISFGIQTVAKVGQAAVSKTRGSVFLSKANEGFFNPRGLKVELVTSDALKVKLGMDPNALLAITSQTPHDQNASERRVAALKGYAAPVTFNVPPPDQQTNLLDRMSAAQQKRTMAKHEKEYLKERSKHATEEDSSESTPAESDDDFGKEGQKLESLMRKEMMKRETELDKINREHDGKVAKKPKDASKIESEREKEVGKVEKEYHKEMDRLQEKLGKLDRGHKKDAKKHKKHKGRASKETKALNKIQWILVESL